MAGDWFKVHRKLKDSRVFSDQKCLKMWVWCLCKANYKAGFFNGEEVAPGSFITGRLAGSEECGISPSSWYRGMLMLESWGMITLKANNKWTTVTLVQWRTYQTTDSDAQAWRPNSNKKACPPPPRFRRRGHLRRKARPDGKESDPWAPK